MQQEWDSIDRLIISSEENIVISEDFNSKLLIRLRNEKRVKRNFTGALSLIAAGLLLLTIYTGGLQYNLIDMKYRVKLELITLQNNFFSENNILGE